MKISDMLNPTSLSSSTSLALPPVKPRVIRKPTEFKPASAFCIQLSPPQSPPELKERLGKPRSRFSDEEDAIICEGVAKGLTWGQISGQLPHRKRATCFNRYRTLQGIRKSRKQKGLHASHHLHLHHRTHLPPLSPKSPDSTASFASSRNSFTLSPPLHSLPHINKASSTHSSWSTADEDDVWSRTDDSFPRIHSTDAAFPTTLPSMHQLEKGLIR